MMHLAYLHKREKIAKFLDEHDFYNIERLYRNYLGQLPGEMTHKQEDNQAFEKRSGIESFIVRNKRHLHDI